MAVASQTALTTWKLFKTEIPVKIPSQIPDAFGIVYNADGTIPAVNDRKYVISEKSLEDYRRYLDDTGLQTEYAKSIEILHLLGGKVKTVDDNGFAIADDGSPPGMAKNTALYCVDLKAKAVELYTGNAGYAAFMNTLLTANYTLAEAREKANNRYKGIVKDEIDLLRKKYPINSYAEYFKKYGKGSA